MAADEIQKKEFEELKRKIEKLERLLSDGGSSVYEPPEDHLSVAVYDAATGQAIHVRNGSKLKLRHKDSEVTGVVKHSSKDRAYFELQGGDIPRSTKDNKSQASIQSEDLRDVNCVRYTSPVVYFDVPAKGEACCCPQLPASAQAGTYALTVQTYHEDPKQHVNDVEITVTPLPSPLSEGVFGAQSKRQMTPMKQKSQKGFAVFTGVPQGLVQIQAHRSGYSCQESVRYYNICCDPSPVTFDLTPCSAEDKYSIILINGDECGGRAVIPVLVNGSPSTTDDHGNLPIPPGTTWPVHLSTDQPNVAFDPAVVQKPATKGGVAIVTVKTLLESAIEHISEHIRLIEIRVVDDDGEPFVHREMIEVAPDGSRRRLRTDHEGRVHARHDAMLSAEENEDAAAIEAFPVFKLAIEQ